MEKEKSTKYDNLKIREEIAYRFKRTAATNGINYSKFLERLMDDSPLCKYFESIVKLDAKKNEINRLAESAINDMRKTVMEDHNKKIADALAKLINA